MHYRPDSRNPSSANVLLSVLLVLITIGVPVLALSGCDSPTTATETSSAAGVVPAALSRDTCYSCHKISTQGITMQFVSSTMSQNDVTCTNCHVVASDYPGAESHNGAFRLASPTPAMCQKCHPTEVSQFVQGRHSLPAYVAVHGVSDLTAEQLAMYQAIPEGGYDLTKTEHPLAALEGEAVVPFACDACHKIGQANADGSAGSCQSCHLTHSFSLEQVRKPETCSACHIGPDHPQWEIYQESAHGILYATGGNTWNWDADPGAMTIADTPAPTCATCHVSAFGNVAGSHDMGNRLTYFLAAQYSTARPDAQANAARMQAVCTQCHAKSFVTDFYDEANLLTSSITDMLKQADVIMAPLKEKGLVTSAPFDEPIDYIYFDIGHDYGRTAKFGAGLQRAADTQGHGVYEILRNLKELAALAEEKLQESQ
jgi:hypothetical protein